MKSAGLRNKPLDRRYLSDQDKNDYNQSGEYGRRASAVKRARAYRGQMAYQMNRPMNTTSRTPGTGGQSAGIGIQQQRLRKYGEGRRSDFQVETPSLKGDMFKPDRS